MKKPVAFMARINSGRNSQRQEVSARKQLEFAARAFLHIAAAEEFIARENPVAAQKVAEAIYKTAEKLETFPDLGKPGRVPGTRELPLSKFPTLSSIASAPPRSLSMP